MTKKIIFLLVLAVALTLIFKMQMNKDKENTKSVASIVKVDPISHASMILDWDGAMIYTDPVGEASMFEGKPAPDIILLTDIHGDHLDFKRLKTVTAEKTVIIAPKAVANEMATKASPELNRKVSVMDNGEVKDFVGFKIEAIAMYNIPESDTSYHTKGRGNGYVIEKNGTRVYVSGDTAGILEMRNLQNINMAFIAMNLPYTMGIEEAASAVLDFKPKKVYPYHYRTPEGFSDVAKFKEIVNGKNPAIEVVQLEWYPK